MDVGTPTSTNRRYHPSNLLRLVTPVNRRWRLTIFGRSLLLLLSELLANIACWVIAGIIFGHHQQTTGLLNLALLAWTIGLRHGLDADHISAIDNATRGLINLGQLPVTCGLFFSLGHSTIVVAVIVAIAISTDVYDKFINITDIGGIIGSSVSGAFLFIIAVANSIILYRILQKRRRGAQNPNDPENGSSPKTLNNHEKSLLMRLLGPVTTFVNKPWKMYPVGVLFGLGFDTASSIALLAVTALAKDRSDGQRISQSHIIILPLLFTSAMTLVDSADSILMLYSYAGFPEKGWSLFEYTDVQKNKKNGGGRTSSPNYPVNQHQRSDEQGVQGQDDGISSQSPKDLNVAAGRSNDDINLIEDAGLPSVAFTPNENLRPESSRTEHQGQDQDQDQDQEQIKGVDFETVELDRTVKQNTMSGLSIALTLISILVAFSVSLITIMGLIGDNCRSCQEAANAPDGGGLAGAWWRGWAKANDDSGFIGAAIVGGFVAVLVGWYGGKWCIRKINRRRDIQL